MQPVMKALDFVQRVRGEDGHRHRGAHSVCAEQRLERDEFGALTKSEQRDRVLSTW